MSELSVVRTLLVLVSVFFRTSTDTSELHSLLSSGHPVAAFASSSARAEMMTAYLLKTTLFTLFVSVRTLQDSGLLERQRLISVFKDFGQNPLKSEQQAARLRNLNPTQRPGADESYAKYAKGLWRVSYAPHIQAIERLSGTRFDVYYALEDGLMESYVRFESRLLGKAFARGHLCASGSYGSLSDDETSITWKRVWCDLNKFALGPSTADEINKHLSPKFVQTLGILAFVQSVSRFPVFYLDNDVVMFEFSLLGTKIVAAKVNSLSIAEQQKYISSIPY